MWKEGSKVIFQVYVVERNEVAITNAAVELNETGLKTAAPASLGSSSITVSGFGSSAIFSSIASSMADETSRKAQVSKIGAIYQFDLTNAAGAKSSWTIDLKTLGTVSGGPSSAKPDLIVSVSDEDFQAIASGKMQAQKAFMSGKIKVKGNMSLAMKLDVI